MVFLLKFLFASSSIGGFASQVPGNCLTGRCVLRSEDSYLYQALDGTHPMQSLSTGCQSSLMEVPAGWDVSPGYPDAVEIQALVQKYPWGTDSMAAGRRRFNLPTAAVQRRRRSSGGLCTSGSKVFVCACNARVLIRQPYLSRACAHNATAGPTEGCLPSLAFTSTQMRSPELLIKSAGASTVALQLKLTTLPASVYLSHTLSYVFGLATDEASLNSTYTACQEQWSLADIRGNETTFSLSMSYTDYIDFNGTCELSKTITEKYIFLQGVLGVFVWGSANGTDTEIKTWTQRVNISYSTDTSGGLDEDLIAFGTGVITLPPFSTQAPSFAATLQIYKSDAFTAVKPLPAYVVGRPLYAVMTLLGGGDLGIVLKRAWLSLSEESSGAVYHELAIQDHGNAGERNKARFSVVLPLCADCYIYASARIVGRRLAGEEEVDGQDDERELQDIGDSITSNSLLITVLPSSPTPSGSQGLSHADPEWQSWIIILVVLVVLVFAAATILLISSKVVRKLLAKCCRTRRRRRRYQGIPKGTDQEHEDEEDEEKQELEEHHSDVGPDKALPLGSWPSKEAEESI